MRKTTTFALAAILFAGPSLADPYDHVAQAIAQRTKATIEAVTPEFGNVKFAHSAAHEMTLFCNPRSPSLFVAYDGKPDARFLRSTRSRAACCSARRSAFVRLPIV